MELNVIPPARLEAAALLDGIRDCIPTREDIERLQAAMLAEVSDGSMQVPEMRTEHYFSGGMYCRKLWRPVKTYIVGKVHLKDHLFLCAAGEIMTWTETGMRVLKAGDVVESRAGTKRATLALTDAIGITIHKTDKIDLDEIEAELIEPDQEVLFDARNQVKSLTFEGEKS